MLNRLLVRLLIITCTSINSINATEFRTGHLTLKQVIDASKIIANSIPYRQVDKNISGTVIEINNKIYEIRYFTFNDTRLKLSKKYTFKKYVNKNKLANLKSISSSPIDNINFETFDYRLANIKDGVLFSLSLRLIDEH